MMMLNSPSIKTMANQNWLHLRRDSDHRAISGALNAVIPRGTALIVALTCGVVSAQQTCQTDLIAMQPKADYDVSQNSGGTVTHAKTGLTWLRCSAGQSWNGNTCTGAVTSHTWQAALQLAKNETAYGGGWRVPNIRELQSIVELACQAPAVNSIMFPNAIPSDYWSSSSDAGNLGNAWIVNLNFGSDGTRFKFNSNYAVQLVRGGESFTDFDTFATPVVTPPTPPKTPPKVTLRVLGDVNGSISPQGTVEVPYDGALNFSITANPRYVMRIGGTCDYQRVSKPVPFVPIGTGLTEFVLNNLTSDCNVDASFSALSPRADIATEAVAEALFKATERADNYVPPMQPLPTSSVLNQAVTLLAWVTRIAGVPYPSATNVITFNVNGMPIAGCENIPLALRPSNVIHIRQAKCTTTFSSVGSITITSSFAGDVYNFPAASSALNHSVVGAP